MENPRNIARFVLSFGLIVIASQMIDSASSQAVEAAIPPIAFETTVDLKTGETRVVRIAVRRDGRVRHFGPDDWVRPRIAGYAQAPAGIIVAFGSPGSLDLPTGRQSETGAVLPATPGEDERVGTVIDDFVNSVLLNIAADRDGLVLAFDDRLVNRPGPDLVIAEIGLPPGGVSAGCPGIPAPGADPVKAVLQDGRSVSVPSSAYTDFGPAGMLVNHGNPSLTRHGERLESLQDLRTADLRPLAAIDYFKTHVTTIDLSALGMADGATLDRIAFRSVGSRVDTLNGERLCWTADPAFIVGLP